MYISWCLHKVENNFYITAQRILATIPIYPIFNFVTATLTCDEMSTYPCVSF